MPEVIAGGVCLGSVLVGPDAFDLVVVLMGFGGVAAYRVWWRSQVEDTRVALTPPSPPRELRRPESRPAASPMVPPDVPGPSAVQAADPPDAVPGPPPPPADALITNTARTAADLARAADDVERALCELLSRLVAAAGVVAGTSKSVVGSVAEASERLAGAATASEASAGRMDEVRSTVDAIARTVSLVQQRLSSSRAVVKSVVETAENTNRVVEGLKGASDDIGETATIIDGLARQTNLLALNAAIEAARAGVAGRGFGVVADEVKELARRTSAAAKSINASVRSIKDQVGDGLQAIGRLTAATGSVEETLTSLEEPLEQQRAASLSIQAHAEDHASSARAMDEELRALVRFVVESEGQASESVRAASTVNDISDGVRLAVRQFAASSQLARRSLSSSSVASRTSSTFTSKRIDIPT